MLMGNPMIFHSLPLEDALARTVDAGFDGLELWPPQIASCCTPALRKQLAQRIEDMGAKAIRLNCANRDYFQSITSADDVPKALAGLKADFDMACDLGMSQLLSWEGRKAQDVTSGQINGPIFDATVDLLGQACVHGRDKGVSLTVEVHPFTLGIDLDWLCRLCDAIDDEQFSVTYDCCHFAVGLPDGYVDAINKLGHRIGHVHFSDSDKKNSELHFAPGTGCLDVDGIVDALKRNHFSGSMMLDLWLYPLPEYGTKIGARYLQDVMRRLDQK